MRVARLVAAGLVTALAGPAMAWNDTLDTPAGVARVEGDRMAGEPLRLIVGERELYRSEDWMEIWPEAVAGGWLLVGLGSGGTACPAEWVWIALEGGAQSEVFGTCATAEAVEDEPDGTLTVTMYSYDPDWPRARFAFDGTAVTEERLPQEPAPVPPGAPGDAWVGLYPYELFLASDWRGPLVELLGEEGYDLGQEAFGQVGPFEAEGDWIVGWGCMMHACGMLEGRIAIHRTDGRVIVAMAREGKMPVLWGDPKGELPPTVAELMEQF